MKRLCVGGIVVALAVLMQRPVEAQVPKVASGILEDLLKDVDRDIETAQNRLRAQKEKWAGANPKQAQAIQDILDERQVEKKVFESVQKRLPEERLLPKLVGSWKNKNSPFKREFFKDGKVTEYRDGMKNAEGQCKEDTPGIVTVTLDNQYTLEIRMAGHDRLAVLIWEPGGALFGYGEVVERVRQEDPKLEAS